MPRMSKKRKQEWSLFLNENNRITYTNYVGGAFTIANSATVQF